MNKREFGYIYILLTVIVLLRAIPFFAPMSRTWGFNQLIFLPGSYAAIFFVIAVGALVLPNFKRTELIGESISERFSELFYDSKWAILFRFAFVVIMTALFIVFAATTHFLGDGYALLNNIASETGTFIKWSEQGVTWILLFIQSMIGPKSMENALLAFQILSVFSGAITIWIFFKIAGILTDNAIRRFLIFGVLTFSPLLLMFFGYVESYPLLWIGFSAFLYFSIKYLKSGDGIWWALIFLVINIFLHLQTIVLAPAFVYLIFCRGRGLEVFRRFKFWLISLGIILTGLGMVYFVHKYSTDLYFENMFLPLITGKPIYPVYSLISWPHLIDVLNQLLLLSPLLPLLVFISIKYFKRIVRNKESLFLALVSLGTFCFLFFIDPKLSMPRDWDLFSSAACGITLLSILLIHDSILPVLKKFLVTILILLMLFPLPYLLTNLEELDSIEYMEYMINLDLQKSFSTIFVLNKFLLDNGYDQKADSLRITYNTYPFPKSRYDQALNTLKSGNVDRAWAIFNATLKDRFDQNYHTLLKELYLQEKNYDKALYHTSKAIELQRYADYLYANRGEIYLFLKEYDKALDDFRHGFELNNKGTSHLEGMAATFFRLNMPDSGIYYTHKMLEVDSTKTIGYYMLAQAYINKRDTDRARYYTTRFADFVAKDSALMPLLKQIIDAKNKAHL